MKRTKTNFITGLMLLFLSIGALNGQECPDSYIFYYQSHIDTFLVHHPNCTEISGNMFIHSSPNNDPITDLSRLINIKKVTGNLSISFNDQLANLKGLESIKSVGGYLLIDDNYALENLSGLDGLETVGEYVQIQSNGNLITLSGLNQLKSVGQNLNIFYNNSLKNLKGLDGLRFIGNHFYIHSNLGLTSMEGLGSKVIQGLDKLELMYNNSLRNLTGMEALPLVHIPNITIESNASLSNCACQSICDYIAICDTLFLHRNASVACNNNQKLEEACASFDKINFTTNCRITLFPNPVNDYLNIRIRSVHVEEYSYEIYDMSNRFISQGQAEGSRINLSNLEAGPYIIRLKTSRQNSVFRFVKN